MNDPSRYQTDSEVVVLENWSTNRHDCGNLARRMPDAEVLAVVANWLIGLWEAFWGNPKAQDALQRRIGEEMIEDLREATAKQRVKVEITGTFEIKVL